MKLLRRHAFTLIELLVVIIVVGVLLAIAAPSFLGQQDKAKDSETKQTLSTVYKAARTLAFTDSDRGTYPALGATQSEDGTILGMLKKSEPQYDFAAYEADPMVLDRDNFVPGTVTVRRHDASTLSVCQRSESGVVFCFKSDENGGLTMLASAPSLFDRLTGVATAYAAANIIRSTGQSEADARAALEQDPDSPGRADRGPTGSGRPGWVSMDPSDDAPKPGDSDAGPIPPAVDSLPEIQGTPNEGQTVTGTNGQWSGNPVPENPSETRWLRCDSDGENCAPIAGADEPTYIITSADVGQTLRYRVTMTNPWGSQTARSEAVAVGSPPVSTEAPAISGTGRPGQQLTGAVGTWTGTPTPTISQRQWLRCDTEGANCTPISGATSATYTVASADQGKTVRFRVTAQNSSGSLTAQSPPKTIETYQEQTVNLGVYAQSIGWACCTTAGGASPYFGASGAYYTNGNATNEWRFTYANVPSGWVIKKIRTQTTDGNTGFINTSQRVYDGGSLLFDYQVPTNTGQACPYGCDYYGNYINHNTDSGWLTLGSPLTVAQAGSRLRHQTVSTMTYFGGAYSFAPTAQAVVANW